MMGRGQKLSKLHVNQTMTDHCQSHTVSDKKQQLKFITFHFLIIEKNVKFKNYGMTLSRNSLYFVHSKFF